MVHADKVFLLLEIGRGSRSITESALERQRAEHKMGRVDFVASVPRNLGSIRQGTHFKL